MKKVLITGIILIVLIAAVAADIQDLNGVAKKNLRSANNYYRQKIYEKAMPFYQQVIEENPNHVESLFNMAGIYYEVDLDYATAYEFYNRTLSAIQKVYDEYAQLKETDEKAAKKYHKKYIDKEDLDKKEEMAKLLQSNSWKYIYKSGYDHYIVEEYDIAIQELTKLHALAPDSLLTIKMLGNSNLKQGNIETAISYFKQLVDLEPENEQNAQLIANQYFQLDQKDLAVQYYEKASEINPENPDNYFNMGICYTNLEEPAKAMAMFTTTLEYEPTNLDAAYNAKVIAQQLKDMDSFLRFSEMEFEINGYDAESLRVFCYQLNSLELYEAVLKFGEKWSDLAPNESAPYQLMFLAANKLGKIELKEQYQKKLQDLN
ncbi:MAG: tetratricopeptide repeat protein [Candidatus Stygibacter australis]|nr:tetratricopeptide repeat protein [Candidatus Stygibacter australis]